MILLLPVLLLQVSAPTSAAATPPPALTAQQPLLSAGTQLRFTTDALLDSRSLVQGQRFGLKLADDVMVGGKVVIPRGTAAVGEVESLREKGMLGKSAKFVVRPLFIEWNGRRINVVGSNEHSGKRAVTEAAVATAVVTFGVFITGKSATLPAGSMLYGAVRDDVMVSAAR
jgi:hypothetical protein